MDDSFDQFETTSETIDDEVIKTHFPRDNNSKITTFDRDIE